MNDPDPHLTKTEMRQGNSRMMNMRVLVIGTIIVVIGFALALWYNMSVSPDTATTTQGGETLEQMTPEGSLENLPTPAPVQPDAQ